MLLTFFTYFYFCGAIVYLVWFYYKTLYWWAFFWLCHWCACLCVCLFPFTVKFKVQSSEFVSPEFRPVMVCCGNIFVSRTFISVYIPENNLQANNCGKECQLNQGNPQEAKDDSYKLFKKLMVNKCVKHIFLPSH